MATLSQLVIGRHELLHERIIRAFKILSVSIVEDDTGYSPGDVDVSKSIIKEDIPVDVLCCMVMASDHFVSDHPDSATDAEISDAVTAVFPVVVETFKQEI